MAEYAVNKGIGKPAELKGLQSQYLFIFAGGLLAVFVVFVVMYMADINQWICILFGVIAASVLVWLMLKQQRLTSCFGLFVLNCKSSGSK